MGEQQDGRSIFRDPRIDRAISWAGVFVASIAFSISAWFFSGLEASIDDLRDVVTRLDARLALVENDRRDVEDHEGRIRQLEQRVPAKIPPQWFLDRVKELEDRLGKLERDAEGG